MLEPFLSSDSLPSQDGRRLLMCCMLAFMMPLRETLCTS